MIKDELLKKIGLVTDDMFTTGVNRAALQEYTAEQIQEAYIDHVKHSPWAIKVSDIVGYWDKKRGNTDAALEQKAALIYEKFFKYPKTGFDHVADKRTVYAFRVAFGTLTEYGKRTNFIDGIDKKEFIKAYVNAKQQDFELAGNVIEGRNHNYAKDDPSVICIGKQAEKLAFEIYGKNVRIVNAASSVKALPHSAPAALENKNALSPLQAKAIRNKVMEQLDRFLTACRV